MRVAILVILIGSFYMVSAQNNLQLQYGYRGSVAGSKFLPSTLDLGKKRLQFGLNYKLWVSNRSLSYHDIRTIQRKKELSESDINGFIDNLEDQNIIGVGQDLMVLGIGINTKIREKPVNFSFSVSDRMSASFRYPKSLLQLAWKGNKQFEGQQVDLAGSLDARYFREYALGTALNIARFQDWSVRIGLALKYYQGIAAIYMPKNHLLFETGNEGDYLSIDYNYDIFLAGINEFSAFDTKGSGLGGNVGLTMMYDDRLALDVGLSDMGSIRFKKDTQVFKGKGYVEFSGLTRDDLEDVSSYADSLVAIFENEIVEGEYFNMPLGKRLQVQLTYQFINDNAESNPGNLFITYIQGFDELPGVTKRPRFSIGYNQRVLKRLYLGINSSWGGFNNLAIGSLVSIRLGKTRFGIHTDDFTGDILARKGTGLGVGFIFQTYL